MPFQFPKMGEEVPNIELDKRIKNPMPDVLKTNKTDYPEKLSVKEGERYRILMEYGGVESDIPINSPYWQLDK